MSKYSVRVTLRHASFSPCALGVTQMKLFGTQMEPQPKMVSFGVNDHYQGLTFGEEAWSGMKGLS